MKRSLRVAVEPGAACKPRGLRSQDPTTTRPIVDHKVLWEGWLCKYLVQVVDLNYPEIHAVLLDEVQYAFTLVTWKGRVESSGPDFDFEHLA